MSANTLPHPKSAMLTLIPPWWYKSDLGGGKKAEVAVGLVLPFFLFGA
jgi:hypothetical protein